MQEPNAEGGPRLPAGSPIAPRSIPGVFPREHLEQGESIIFETRAVPWPFLGQPVGLIVLIVIVLIAFAVFPSLSLHASSIGGLAVVLLVVAIALVVVVLVVKRSRGRRLATHSYPAPPVPEQQPQPSQPAAWPPDAGKPR